MNTQDNAHRLREYYQGELSYLRKAGVEFARQYPGIAGRLELGADVTPDPFTERLIESFAWLTGRIRHTIDSRIPQVSATLLGTLYPNFTAPVPSMSIAEFRPDMNRPELAGGITVAQGTSLECSGETSRGGDELTLKWRTAWPVTLYPIRLTCAEFRQGNSYVFSGEGRAALSVLRLQLESPTSSLEECDIRTVRIFLHGNRFDTFALYDKLLLHRLDVGLFNPDSEICNENAPVALGKNAIRPIGLSPEEFVLPQSLYALPAYQLVQEYFAFPERFLFLELTMNLMEHLQELTRNAPLRKLDLLIPLNWTPDGIDVAPEMFRLHTTPVVNLFPKISEPIDLDETRSEYRLLADARRNESTEIHTVESVSMIDPENGDTLPIEPFFSPIFSRTESKEKRSKSYWITERTPSSAGVPGTDVWMRFVDAAFRPDRVESRTVFARILCTNRNRASEAPEGTLLRSDTELPCRLISLLVKPTAAQTPPMDGETLWMLISHLSLNHLSLEGNEGAAALRDILRLYVPRDNLAAQRQLQGLYGMQTTPIIRRMGKVPWRGFVQGIGIEMTLDETYFTGGSAYLFAEVMNQFFRLYVGINTPTELTWKNIIGNELRKQWKPNFGLRPKL